MRYPNKAQWRVIWTMAIGFTIVTILTIDRSADLVMLALLIDGVLLVWKLQK
jgi:hypothetical protein